MEGDKGGAVASMSLGLAEAGERSGQRWSRQAEGDVGHASAVSRRLVVVGAGRGAVLKILLQLCRGDSLEGSGRGAVRVIRLNQISLWLKVGQDACRWR